MPNVFDRPTDLVFKSQDLRVAFFVNGAWDFGWTTDIGHIAARIRVDNVSTGLNASSPKASLSLDLTGNYQGDTKIRSIVELGDVPLLVHHDDRICVFAEIPSELPGGGPVSRMFLFEGYAKECDVRFGEQFIEGSLSCLSLFDRLATEKDGWVTGRWMLRYPNEDDPAMDPANPELRFVPSAPCVFNYKGFPNRAPDIVTVNGLTNIPCFTYDGDPDAVFWRYADILTYLLGHYHAKLGEQYPLKDGNGKNLCTETVQSDDVGELVFQTDRHPYFHEVVAARSVEVTMEGMALKSAILAWCKVASCVVQSVTFRTADGQPETRMLFNLSGDGGPFTDQGIPDDVNLRTIRAANADKAIPHFPFKLRREGVQSSTMLTNINGNDVHQADLVIDDSGIVSGVQVVGGVQQFEVTVGKHGIPTTGPDWCFLPLWTPDAMFGDDLTGAAVDAKVDLVKELSDASSADDLSDDALTMFQRYVRAGANYDDYSQTGRRWGLNEAGEYLDSEYGRTNGPSSFKTPAYKKPFDFHEACGVPLMAAGTDDKKAWEPRRRRILLPLSTTADGQELKPIVWATWDGHLATPHWYEYPGGVHVLKESCGLLLTDQNLAKVLCPGSEEDGIAADVVEMSVWEAIVRGQFRIACTFTVEGDGRVTGDANAANLEPYAVQPHVAKVFVHENLKYGKRCNSEWIGNAAYKYNIVDGIETNLLDETSRAIDLANRYLLQAQGRIFSGNVICPWFRNDWWPGDLVSGIQPRGLAFESTRSVLKRYPQVVSVTWHNAETSCSTHINFGDERTAIHDVAPEENTGVLKQRPINLQNLAPKGGMHGPSGLPTLEPFSPGPPRTDMPTDSDSGDGDSTQREFDKKLQEAYEMIERYQRG